MQIYTKIVLPIIILLLLVSEYCYSLLHLGTNHFPPYSMEEEGQRVGLITEQIRGLLQHANLNFQINHYPLAQGLERLHSKSIDGFFPLIGLDKCEEFSNLGNLVLGPVAEYQVSLFVNKKFKGKIENIEHLVTRDNYLGTSIIGGVAKGSIVETQLAAKHIKLKSVTTDIQAANMMLANRVHFWATERLSGIYQAFNYGVLDNLQIAYEGEKIPIYFVFSSKINIQDKEQLLLSYQKLDEEGFFKYVVVSYESRFEAFLDLIDK